ncbi:MAG: hypothetical protein WC433_08360 [Candidatus Omnitrophota bacterium]|jgi:hypothetical protein
MKRINTIVKYNYIDIIESWLLWNQKMSMVITPEIKISHYLKFINDLRKNTDGVLLKGKLDGWWK